MLHVEHCSKPDCAAPRRKGGRYCKRHHAEAMRSQRQRDLAAWNALLHQMLHLR